MNKALTAISLQLVIIVAVPITYFAYPVIYARLSTEDNWGEFATFAALLVGSVLFAVCFRLNTRNGRRGWYLLLAIVAFLVAMEEISWGQRIMQIETPELLRKINLQDEINLHNISWIFPHSTSYLVAGSACIFFGFFLPLATSLSPKIREFVQRINLPLPRLYLSPIFLAAGYFVGFTSLYKGAEVGELFLALSLGSMAADHLISSDGALDRNSDGTKRILFAVGVFLAIGAVAVQLLLPLLISSAYKGESFAFVNNVISGQSEHAVDFYILKGQRAGWSAIGIAVVLAAMWGLFRRRRRKPGDITQGTAQWARVSAIPLFLVGSLVLGVLLTDLVGRPDYFRGKLTSIAISREFVGLGLSRRALSIVDYLESTSDESSGRLLALRGFALLNLDRPEDAVPVLKEALARDLRAYAENRGSAGVLDRIAAVYDRLGQSDAALRYWRESLSLRSEMLNDADSDARRTRLHTARAQTFEAMGDNNRAIEEYLWARDNTDSGEEMIQTERAVRRLLRNCLAANGSVSPVSDDQIVAILDTPQNRRQNLNSCR